MSGTYKTSNHTVIVHHEGAGIECGGETHDTVIPSADEAYKCRDCDITVAEESGEAVVRGEVSDDVLNNFDLEEVF